MPSFRSRHLTYSLILLMSSSTLTILAQTSLPLRDSVTTTFSPECSPVVPSKVQFPGTINWATIRDQYRVKDPAPKCTTTVDKDQAYIFHVARWATDGRNYSLTSSAWYVYESKGSGDTLQYARLAANGEPEIYAKKRALIFAVNIFDPGKSGGLSISYKVSVKQGTPENVQNLEKLVTALLGLSLPAVKAQCKVTVAVACQEGTAHPSF